MGIATLPEKTVGLILSLIAGVLVYFGSVMSNERGEGD